MTSLGLLILRLVVGGIFALHGYPKLFGGEGKSEKLSPGMRSKLGEGFAQSLEHGGLQNTIGMTQSMNLPMPQLAGTAVSVAEFGGGVALMAGWMTRPVALALLFSQLVAVNKVHAKNGLIGQGGFEYNSVLIAATATLALTGPGALALD